MKFQPNNFYHIYNRGNNKQCIFPKRNNYIFFLKKLKTEICPHCNIVAYCLMPNHYHLLVYVDQNNNDFIPSYKMQILQRKFGTLQSSYTRAINIQEKKTGSLFQQKFKMIELCEEPSGICFHYLHQNPIKAGLRDRFEDWIYSSYNEYYSNTADSVCNK